MVECQECGAHVSAEFARVMGDNQRRVFACPSCAPNTLGPQAGGIEVDDRI